MFDECYSGCVSIAINAGQQCLTDVIQGVFPPLTTLDSNAAEADVDVTNFDEVMEVTLTWLLEAQDALAKHDSISDDVATVKEQFQKHEVLVEVFCKLL